MKFGKTFLRSQLPEWSTYYVSYKSLKHLIKRAQKASAPTTTTTTTTTSEQPTDTNTAFFYALDRELEKVNAFFLYKRAELERRIRILQEKYRHAHPSFNSSSPSPPSSTTSSPTTCTDPETDEAFLQALLETKDSIHKTIRFSQLNLTAFRKISKKYDKKLHHHTQKAFLETKVLCLPFANPNPFDLLLEAVEILIHDSRFRLTQTTDSSHYNTTTANSNEAKNSHDDEPARKFLAIQPEQEIEFETCLSLDDETALENLIHVIAEKLPSSSKSPNDLPPLILPSSKKPSKLNRILTEMLYRACSVRAFKCIAHLLVRGASLSPHDDINGRTLLHRLAMSGGSLPSSKNGSHSSRRSHHSTPFLGGNINNHSESDSVTPDITRGSNTAIVLEQSQDDATLVSYVLENLPSNIGWSLPDLHGRRPLHYAALNGYANIVKVLIRAHLQGATNEDPMPPFTHPCWCDNDGYTPLFYAILRGHVNVVRILIEEGKMSNVNVLVSAEPPPPSTLIYFPTHLPALPSPAFGSLTQPGPTGSAPSCTNAHHQAYAHTHTPLAVACKLGHVSTAEYLVSKGADVNIADGDGETALHLAAKNGFWKCVAALVSVDVDEKTDLKPGFDETSDANKGDSVEKRARVKANVEVRERMFGWTPLFSAVIEGHIKCVSVLLKAGADPLARDSSGWNPHEHAVFRGHMDIAALFRPLIPPYPIPASPFTTPKIEESTGGPFDQAFKNAYKVPSGEKEIVKEKAKTRGSRGTSPSKNNKTASGNDDDAVAERAYGHRYLENQSMIIVTLGTNDARNPVRAVEIHSTRIPAASIMPSTSVSLVISASHASGEPAVMDLPVVNETDPSMEPIVFYAENVSDVIIKFDLVPTYGSSTRKEILGRAVALLSSVKTPIGKDRTPLAGSVTVPIIGVGGMEVIGRVVFEFLVVKPFVHDKLAVGSLSTYWKSISTKLIGHRGFGANRYGSPSLQLGENTLLSFITAASLGAEYVEFDVQLTKDRVPIVYHDWNVTETGVHIPVNAITLREFLSLRRELSRYTVDDGAARRRTSLPKKSESPISEELKETEGNGSWESSRSNRRNGAKVFRSASMHVATGNGTTTRRESTKIGGKKEEEGGGNGRGKMKGNGPGTVQAPFATLRETLEKVPPTVGFNIEVKYPMIDEAEAYDLREAHELNLFVDSILKCVYDHAGQRNVLFSSFHPDVCRMLNFKQPNYPVFFLTDAGSGPVADVRCRSMQEAVRFARTSDLLGIVSNSGPVLEAPCLVQTIKEAGLLLFTYGALNNDVENVRLQRQYGVDAVIVDQVVAVRKGLQKM